jgi:hypothetical protein
MAKKVFLEIRSDPAYYTMIGISCHLKDYRLSYLLNQELEFKFSRIEDLMAFLPGKKIQAEFALYYFRDEDRFNTYCLLANRSQEAVLVPELRQTDFLLLVEGEFRKAQKDPVLKAIRSIPNVLTSYEIRLAEVKNIDSLLTDIEMHLMNVLKEKKKQYVLIPNH